MTWCHLSVSRSSLGHLEPVPAQGSVQGLHVVSRDVRAAVVRGRGPVHHHVVVEDVGHLARERRRGLICMKVALCDVLHVAAQITHNIDIYVSFVLALSIFEDNLVCPRLFSPWIDHREVHIVASDGWGMNEENCSKYSQNLLDGEINVLSDLQFFSIFENKYLQWGLYVAVDLNWHSLARKKHQWMQYCRIWYLLMTIDTSFKN